MVQDDFGSAVDVEGDDRNVHQEGLDDGAGESFPLRSMGEYIATDEEGRDLSRGDQTGQGSAVTQAELFQLSFIVGPLGAVADPDETQFGVALGGVGHDGDELFVTFLAE